MRTSGCVALAVNARYRQGPEEALRTISASDHQLRSGHGAHRLTGATPSVQSIGAARHSQALAVRMALESAVRRRFGLASAIKPILRDRACGSYTRIGARRRGLTRAAGLGHPDTPTRGCHLSGISPESPRLRRITWFTGKRTPWPDEQRIRMRSPA
jgi:hypothetical protein